MNVRVTWVERPRQTELYGGVARVQVADGRAIITLKDAHQLVIDLARGSVDVDDLPGEAC